MICFIIMCESFYDIYIQHDLLCVACFPSHLIWTCPGIAEGIIRYESTRKKTTILLHPQEKSRYLFLWPDENRRLWINNESSVPPSAQLRRICCFVISYLLRFMQKIQMISKLFCQNEFWDTLANVDERNTWEQVICNIEKLNVCN